ncbi:glycerophosphodiester phosphodiesterase family protein [Ohtaekwangia koreensis]|uniref:Por secretion system C-terminal sorting domain-containing protein n=1 Tax=Ohtaekwangia koreensis TaxID=688867 RepID=A0A1T5M578_9BACT|nr:glycerophosphodiester phosphodiesterase family protein [Ohtaekwangia koreensis]SKC83283.1 Por secretion system C-terminal sorting domain-containing protein [Ohtaekwangia koreensis]
MQKTKTLLSSLLLWIAFSSSLLAQQYKTNYIINTLKRPQKDLVAVCAHRGYWRERGVPENSLAAIQRAVNVGIETIELDIKLSSDGVPVLMHDVTLGRITNAPQVFPSKGNNPPVNWCTNGDLQKLRLKDRYGSLTNEHLPTLWQALEYIKNQRLSVVIVLDIKDRQATRACWDVVKWAKNYWGTPAYDWVIFKLNATVYGENPSTMEDDLQLKKGHKGDFGQWITWEYNFKYVPVFTTNMYEKLNCLKTYNNYKNKPYFISVEVDLKQDRGIHSDIVNQAKRDKKTLVCFNALPDAGGDRFWKVDYSGTYRLKDIYYTAPGGSPRDTDDKRGSWQWLVGWRCRWITTDEPYTLITDYLKPQGKRNTSWYYKNWANSASGRLSEEGDSLLVEDDTLLDTINYTSQTTDAFSKASTSSTTDSLSVFPNPTDGRLSVSVFYNITGYVTINLYDASGVVVFQQGIRMEDGLQDLNILDLKAAGVKPGIYALQAILPEGRAQKMIRIVLR